MESIDAMRDWWRDRFPVMDERLGTEFRWRIDGIEREVERERVDAYTKGYDEGFASADDWAAQHEDAMAEHGWVRKNKEHVISHATVEVTPHIDWSRMADELDEFVEIVRGMAGDE